MKHRKPITVLVLMICAAAITASSFGIFSDEGTGQYIYDSIRGKKIVIYGDGIYKHMSAGVAVQGIAQDYITLFICVPLLLVSVFLAVKNSLKGLLLLAGTTGYFLVTYLFYMTMGMYNRLFLVYAFLLGASFFVFILILFSFNTDNIKQHYKSVNIIMNAGIFLILNGIFVALLWLSIIVPPLIDGTVIPAETEHYTTLIVQGFDLAVLLPAAFVIGWLAVKKNNYGFLFTPVYTIFLSLLMIALVSKIIFMADSGVDVIPAVFIIPAIAFTAIVFSLVLLKNVKE